MIQFLEFNNFINTKIASDEQVRLSNRLQIEDLFENIDLIAACDVSFDKNIYAYATVVLYSYKEDKVVDIFYNKEEVQVPYIPTFFSYREIPPLLKILREIQKFDLLLMDGQGIAHPRKMGLASHLGVLFNIPSIGCAKRKLIGNYVIPGNNKGDFSYLFVDNEKRGVVLRTKINIKPLFVSPGHKISIETSKNIVLSLCKNFKYPEPLRLAHHYSKNFYNKGKQEQFF